jgi:hypothetical protein
MKENFGVGYSKFIIRLLVFLFCLTDGIEHSPFRGPGGIVTA